MTGKTTIVKENGQDKDAFTITFTNGAKQQLDELTKHFKTPDELGLLKLAISLLQKLKEIDEKKKNQLSNDETAK